MKKTIIVADDDQVVLDQITRTLQDFYEVIALQDGFDVIFRCETDQVDAVILDNEFADHGLSGIETAEVLRSRHPMLTIVMITAHPSSSHLARKSQELGIIMEIKPVSTETLRNLIDSK